MQQFHLHSRFNFKILSLVAIILLATAGIYAFCVFSNTSGDYRNYALQDLPFQYKISSPTPNEYYPAIHASAENWNQVQGCFFQFAYAGTTSVTSLGRDHINLIFFDQAGINFPQNTNAIAFSSTFTTTVNGDYRATESDLIYNARDYPPAMDGNPNQIDLEGVLTHELGHHLGIAHFGDVGGPPGCGELLPAATMYGVVAPGDTTKRSLHPHDKAAAIELYPEWRVSLSVYDSLTQESIPLALVRSPGTTLIYTTAPEGSQCPGFIVNDSVRTDELGTIAFEPDTSDFPLYISGFGYQSDTVNVHFQDPEAIAGTELVQVNVALFPKRRITISGTLQDSATGAPFTASLQFHAKHDPGDEPTLITTTDSLGTFSVSLPPDEYHIQAISDYPYPDFESTQTFLDSTNEISFTEQPAQILYMYEDYTSDNYLKMRTALDSLGYRYYFWDTTIRDSLPPQASFRDLSQPMILVWSTGDVVTNLLDSTKRAYIKNYLDNGGRLFLSGTNLAWAHSDSAFLENYFHVRYVDKASQLILQSTSADDPLSQGGYAGYHQGVMAPDMIQLTTNQYADISYKYMTTEFAALTRYHNDLYKAVFASFGVEHLINDNPALLTLTGLMDRVITYLTDTEPTKTQSVTAAPMDFRVLPNYPNPFNPSTTIIYDLPVTTPVTVTVYNLMGQTVKLLYSGKQEPGQYSVRWDGRNTDGLFVSSGMYFVKVATEGHQQIQKMMLLR